MTYFLQEVYGEEAFVQEQRYREARERFNSVYGPGEVRFFRAPGRINLIGGHTDYNHGLVMPVALNKDVLLLARPRPDSRVRLRNLEESYSPISFVISPEISSGPAGDWGNYARGAALQLVRRLERDLTGFDGLVVGESPYGVPRGAGLSSSSAMTVVVTVALATLNDWYPAGANMAQLCAEAEWYVGTRGGIMDQFISVLGQRDHALFLDCRPDPAGKYSTELIPLPQGYRIVIADSGVRRFNVRDGYNQRVAACRAGVKLLKDCFPDITYLRDVQKVPWDDLALSLPEETTVGELTAGGIDLGDIPGLTPETVLKVRARCRHVWNENDRVMLAGDALRSRDVKKFGRLLNEAHASARDDYEISCSELEILAGSAREVEGVVGARLTGAGWGGCIVVIVRDDAVMELKEHLKAEYRARAGRRTDIFVCRTASGAGECDFD